MVPPSTKRGSVIAASLAIVLAFPVWTVGAEGPGAPAAEVRVGSGRIKAEVLGSNGKTPIAAAIVRGYHLESGKVYSSAPTSRKGKCEISGLPYGYVDLAVETKDGTFVGNQVINVPPAGTVVVSFTLTKYAERDPAWWNGKTRREFPGPQTPSQGIAELALNPAGREFWKSPKGIAVIGGVAAAALLAVSSGGRRTTASPSTP